MANVAQDKITHEEVVNNKVKIAPIPEEEEEEAIEVCTPQCNVVRTAECKECMQEEQGELV